MANNRMYLKCGGCGAEFMLGKFYPGDTGWYQPKSDDIFAIGFGDFLHTHSDICGIECDVSQEYLFELVYECPPKV